MAQQLFPELIFKERTVQTNGVAYLPSKLAYSLLGLISLALPLAAGFVDILTLFHRGWKATHRSCPRPTIL